MEKFENVSLDLEAICPESNEKVKDIFCTHWKQAKYGLELAALIVKNPIVKAVINIVVKVGDGIEKRICD